jgi:hypothetical protein
MLGTHPLLPAPCLFRSPKIDRHPARSLESPIAAKCIPMLDVLAIPPQFLAQAADVVGEPNAIPTDIAPAPPVD